MDFKDMKIGFALTGSFCTFTRILEIMQGLSEEGADIHPIFSKHVAEMDSRFWKSREFIAKVQEITGRQGIFTIQEAEPIGPKKLLDALIIAPCTGNTLAKLAHSIADGPVTMAAKSHLRNGRPVVLALSTNDGLGGAAENIGRLLARKHYYFVPFGQDDAAGKPRSLIADFALLSATLDAALEGKQLQPILLK